MAALLCYLHSCCFNLGERRLHARYHFTLASPSHDTLTPLPYANEENEMTTTIGALLILAGLGCFVAFNLFGTTVDAQGFLHEPFALLPLGYLLLFTGMVLSLRPLLRRALAKGEKNRP